jgi:hypothetical protein
VRPIAPKAIRYIKLGPGDAWEERAFKRGELYFGRPTEPLDLMASTIGSASRGISGSKAGHAGWRATWPGRTASS